MENADCESHSIAEREAEVSDQGQITLRKGKAEAEMSKYVTMGEEEDEMTSVEKAFEAKRIPPWKEQITFRSMFASFFLSVMFSIIVMKLNLTAGIVPSLNVSAGLLGFFFVKSWTKILEKFGLLQYVFTLQENTENTVIQTCVMAAYGIAFSGGYGSYLFATSSRMSKQSSDARTSQDIKDPHLGWMIGFLFLVSFIGLFSLVPLRKIMILYYKLSYPSDIATIHRISGFHPPKGGKVAKKQVKTLKKFFVRSFLWGCFQWFFTSFKSCGIATFPIFGFQAYKNKFYFNFSATYVGIGMICPYLVNISALLGGLLSWGVMWPLIKNKKGSWYSADLSDSDLHGLQDYKLFISIAMILGDGLYNFVKVLGRTVPASISHVQAMKKSSSVLPVSAAASFDAERRWEVFPKDQILKRSALTECAAVSFGTLQSAGYAPTHPALLALFMLGAWAGASQGWVLVGLAGCGVMINIVSTASNLMQDFKTEYLTPASQRSMFINQVIGTGMGCVIAPCVFWLFYHAFPEYYRSMTISGVDGFASLPAHCLTLCCAFFAAAVLVNLLRDFAGKRWAGYIPFPMAMAIPFYLGPLFAIDMCVGSLVLFVWEMLDRPDADAFAPAVASGLICGDCMWTLPQSVLALAKISPPFCIRFLSLEDSLKSEPTTSERCRPESCD